MVPQIEITRNLLALIQQKVKKVVNYFLCDVALVSDVCYNVAY